MFGFKEMMSFHVRLGNPGFLLPFTVYHVSDRQNKILWDHQIFSVLPRTSFISRHRDVHENSLSLAATDTMNTPNPVAFHQFHLWLVSVRRAPQVRSPATVSWGGLGSWDQAAQTIPGGLPVVIPAVLDLFARPGLRFDLPDWH